MVLNVEQEAIVETARFWLVNLYIGSPAIHQLLICQNEEVRRQRVEFHSSDKLSHDYWGESG